MVGTLVGGSPLSSSGKRSVCFVENNGHLAFCGACIVVEKGGDEQLPISAQPDTGTPIRSKSSERYEGGHRRGKQGRGGDWEGSPERSLL